MQRASDSTGREVRIGDIVRCNGEEWRVKDFKREYGTSVGTFTLEGVIAGTITYELETRVDLARTRETMP